MSENVDHPEKVVYHVPTMGRRGRSRSVSHRVTPPFKDATTVQDTVPAKREREMRKNNADFRRMLKKNGGGGNEPETWGDSSEPELSKTGDGANKPGMADC